MTVIRKAIAAIAMKISCTSQDKHRYTVPRKFEVIHSAHDVERGVLQVLAYVTVVEVFTIHLQI